MVATFDKDLINQAGQYTAYDAREKGVHCILGPVVCLQRTPLIGRGFEAFSEDPHLSGMLAASFINGAQSHGVGCSLKHYAAHDRSYMSPKDDVIATERTLRETSLLPFQLAVKHSSPWSIMTAYNKINGVHASEHPWLLKQVLRED